MREKINQNAMIKLMLVEMKKLGMKVPAGLIKDVDAMDLSEYSYMRDHELADMLIMDYDYM